MPGIRYHYLRGLRLPAPFVNVTLRNLPGTSELRAQPAQIDTAADRTVLPLKTVNTLGLAPLTRITVAGLGGVRHHVRTYLVYLGVHDMPAELIEVIAHAEEQWILLGRDVLNAHTMLHDGPQLALEIQRPGPP